MRLSEITAIEPPKKAPRIPTLPYGFNPKPKDRAIQAPKPEIAGLEMFGAAYFPERGFGWLEVVRAAEKGKGTGREVVEWFENWVREQGGTEVHAEALESSLPFWEKTGYSRVGQPTQKWRYPIIKRL